MNKVDFSKTLNSIFVKIYYLAGLSADSLITRGWLYLRKTQK